LNDAARESVDAAIFPALPVALCLYGFNDRLIIATDAYSAILGLPADALRPGASFLETMRVLAYHGAFGPGDPEQQALALTQADRRQPRRLRRRYPDGRILEIQLNPVPDGRLLLSVMDQTTLVERRDQAEASARRLSDIIEALPVGVAVLDPSLTLLLRNRRFSDLLAQPPELLPIGMTFDQLCGLLAEETAGQGPADTLRAALHQPASAPGWTNRATLESGDLVELSGRGLPQGEWLLTIGGLGAALPVAAADARRNRLNAAILEGLPHGVCVCGADRRVTMFNQAFARLLHGEGIHVGDVFTATPVAGGTFDPARSQLLRRQRSDGSSCELWLMPLPDAGFVCVSVNPGHAVAGDGGGASDGTLGERAAQLEAILAALPAGVLLWDASHRLAAHNLRAAELLELPPDRLENGRPHSEFLSDLAARSAFGNAEETGPRLRELLERDRSRSHMHRRSNRAGRVIEVHSNPMADGGFVVTYSDVTEYRAAEASLRRAKETAEAAHTARSRFLATMSHELRTPLNAVIGYSEALAREASVAQDRGDPLDAEQIAHFTRRAIEFANTINQAGHDLLTLVNNMIDVARIEAGRFDLASDRIELPHLLAGCLRQVSAAARTAEVTIQTHVPPDLPVLLADERRLRQSLLHLMTNAINFTGAGGSVRIAAALAPEGDLLLSVADTGIGISEADQERVFEPFFQVDSGLSRRTSGSGLGLYFARALIGAHGGTLTLSSRQGHGTTVVVRLPRNRLVEP
jgi:signal transduction histidine kinase